MQTLILEIKNGGLGDHLFYSHLPRIAKETKAYSKVLISNHSICRNPEYTKLVWEMNPFIDGFTNEKGIFHLPKNLREGENLLDRIMLDYKLDDGLREHEPEIYFQPAINPALKDAIIYDPNFVSYTGDMSTGRLIEEWLGNRHITPTHQMKQLGKRYLGINGIREIKTDSLLDFCSLIVSCKRIYCLTTGTATLAAALNTPVTVFYGTGHLAKYRHSPMHEYTCLGSDYGLKERTKKWLTILVRKFIPLGTP